MAGIDVETVSCLEPFPRRRKGRCTVPVQCCVCKKTNVYEDFAEPSL
jgi:hypothetical protein